MSSIRTTFAGAAAAVGASAALLLGGVTPVANADPAPPPPIDALQAPGLSAVQSIAPAIQQAAADPTNAVSTLMAAAAVFAGDSAVPPDSRNVATAVNQFVAHVPAPGAVPGAEAHLPAGVDPAHAVGPMPEAAPVAAPTPEAAPAPAPAAVPAPAPAPPPAPDAAAAPTPAAAPEFGPDAPATQDFLYPSISNGCLTDGGNVLATAISVAGPAKIPSPGPGGGPDGLCVHGGRHARPSGRAEAAAERHMGQPDHGQVG